jgi:hypothetical protein
MQEWPYADIAYLNVEHFRSIPQKREYLTVEAVFVSENAVMFFDHYRKEYKRQRSELDEYLQKLGADGWKLTTAGNMVDGKAYRFRRYHFRRAIT